MFHAKKELGQNFLTDKQVVREMVAALSLTSGDLVIEIGSGHGAVTQELEPGIDSVGGSLIAVEIDTILARKLSNIYANHPHIAVVEDDIMHWFPTFDTQRRYKVIGSLPYYLTSPILHMMVKKDLEPDVCVFMVQKEVADKLCSSVPDASYLSSYIQTFFKVDLITTVPRLAFDPSPNVDSAVIKLTGRENEFSGEWKEKYEGFLHRAFSHPRKMLNKAFSQEELSLIGLLPTLRAQNVYPDQWVESFNKIKSMYSK